MCDQRWRRHVTGPIGVAAFTLLLRKENSDLKLIPYDVLVTGGYGPVYYSSNSQRIRNATQLSAFKPPRPGERRHIYGHGGAECHRHIRSRVVVCAYVCGRMVREQHCSWILRRHVPTLRWRSENLLLTPDSAFLVITLISKSSALHTQGISFMVPCRVPLL